MCSKDRQCYPTIPDNCLSVSFQQFTNGTIIIMNSKSTAAAGLLIAALYPSIAYAQSAHQAPPMTPQMLQQVQQARAAHRAAPSATVARHGTIVVEASFDKQSNFTLPVRCYVDILMNTFSSPTTSLTPTRLLQDSLATFNGSEGHCMVSMAYDWPSVDADAVMAVFLSAETAETAFYTDGDLKKPVKRVVTIQRSWHSNNTSIPSDNGVTFYNFGEVPL